MKHIISHLSSKSRTLQYNFREYRECVPMPAQARYDVNVFTCSVREPCEAAPSIPHLSFYLSPAMGGLTLWNACCHLSSITTCCCPILRGLYCLGFILDKSRKALHFMGLGWV